MQICIVINKGMSNEITSVRCTSLKPYWRLTDVVNIQILYCRILQSTVFPCILQEFCLTKNHIDICVYVPNIQISLQTVKVMLMEMQKWRNQCRIDCVCSSGDCIVLQRSSTSRDTSATLHQRKTKCHIRQGNISIESDYWTHSQTRGTDSAEIIHKEEILQREWTGLTFYVLFHFDVDQLNIMTTCLRISQTIVRNIKVSAGVNLNGLKLCENVVIILCVCFFMSVMTKLLKLPRLISRKNSAQQKFIIIVV